MCLKLFFSLILVELVHCAIESFILDGNETQIKNHPHSVYLSILCKAAYFCGGSVLTHQIVLTASHCFEGCSVNSDISIKYGHERLEKMQSTDMRDFIVHEKYNENSMANDIGLVMVEQAMMLGPQVQRVALQRYTPWNVRLAYIAGWGVMNPDEDVPYKLLDSMQELQPPKVCRLLGYLPRGTFCAGSITGAGSPDLGDSGSALIARRYIQIGLVSYKVERYGFVVYTNVSAHYDWIKKTSRALVCRNTRS